jgi:hypothetical protein
VPVSTTTTDANGNYLFDNLTPGDYSAQIVAPTGYFLSARIRAATTPPTATSTPPPARPSSPRWPPVKRTCLGCGLYQKASIGDKVWADCDNDGIQDASEAGVSGDREAAGQRRTVVATTMTDANGNYLFKDLVPGSYSVQVVAPTGYTITAKDQGANDAVDSDADQTTGKTVTTVLESVRTTRPGTPAWLPGGDRHLRLQRQHGHGRHGWERPVLLQQRHLGQRQRLQP